MAISTSKLRRDIYRIIDQVMDTGVPADRARGSSGPDDPVRRSKLANLKPRPYLLADPMDLVHIDWSGEWKP